MTEVVDFPKEACVSSKLNIIYLKTLCKYLKFDRKQIIPLKRKQNWLSIIELKLNNVHLLDLEEENNETTF